MREVIDNYFRYNTLLGEDDEDPFWDPKELVLYARGFV